MYWRGTVSRWDEGTYEILGGAASQPTSPLTPALSPPGESETGTIRIVLHGRKIAGEVVLSESSRHAPRAATEAVVTGRAERASGSAADGTRSVPATLQRYWKFSWKGN